MNGGPDYRGTYSEQCQVMKTIDQDIADFMNLKGFIVH
jgi:hypothetical protein